MRTPDLQKQVFLALILGSCSLLNAEQGVLFLHVSDIQELPQAGVVLTVRGPGSTSPPTDTGGKTRIRLAPQTNPGDWVTLQVLRPTDFVFISPWDARTQVPRFENESENFVAVVLLERGQKVALQNGKVLVALLERFNSAVPLRSADTPVSDIEREKVRQEIAVEFGLAPWETDQALREFGRRARDPYDKGLAALYQENHSEASDLLSVALEIREKAEGKATTQVVDAAGFLGRSLYEQGRYREAVAAFRKAVERRQDDPLLLNGLGASLSGAGQYREAEQLLQRARAEKTLRPRNPLTVAILNNLAALYQDQGRYKEAEPLLQRALAIGEKTRGPEDYTFAVSVHNLGALYLNQARYRKAEPLLQRALAIARKTLGPNHSLTAASLNSLGALYLSRGRYKEAAPLFERALAICEKTLGPEHPYTASSLTGLAEIYRSQGRYEEAEPFYQRAVTIREKALGREHRYTVATIKNYVVLLRELGREEEAAGLEVRAKLPASSQ